jgi:hypothetical protein
MLNTDNETLVLINEKLSEVQLEKIFMTKALQARPESLDNPIIFEKIVYVLNGLKSNSEAFHPPTILHLAKAAQLIGNRVWSHEIVQYIAHIAHEEGWVDMPEVLLFANDALHALHASHELDEDQKRVQLLKHRAVTLYLGL